jgi:predicted nucleic acid-binding protein
MILVDTSVWIDYFNGRPSWQTDRLDDFLSRVPIMVGDLILTEVLQGFRSDEDYQTAKAFMQALVFRSMGGDTMAVQSAENYRHLRKAGATVRKTIDVIIATFCICENLPLLHNDRDFDLINAHLPLKVVR